MMGHISLEGLHDHLKKLNQGQVDETEMNIPEENVVPLFNNHVATDKMVKLVRKLKGLNQAKFIKKSVILFWLLNMTILIWCKHVRRLELQGFFF